MMLFGEIPSSESIVKAESDPTGRIVACTHNDVSRHVLSESPDMVRSAPHTSGVEASSAEVKGDSVESAVEVIIPRLPSMFGKSQMRT
jgi:hypothetical protein